MNANDKSHAGEEQNIDLNDKKKNHCTSKSSPVLGGSQWGDDFYGYCL